MGWDLVGFWKIYWLEEVNGFMLPRNNFELSKVLFRVAMTFDFMKSVLNKLSEVHLNEFSFGGPFISMRSENYFTPAIHFLQIKLE